MFLPQTDLQKTYFTTPVVYIITIKYTRYITAFQLKQFDFLSLNFSQNEFLFMAFILCIDYYSNCLMFSAPTIQLQFIIRLGLWLQLGTSQIRGNWSRGQKYLFLHWH